MGRLCYFKIVNFTKELVIFTIEFFSVYIPTNIIHYTIHTKEKRRFTISKNKKGIMYYYTYSIFFKWVNIYMFLWNAAQRIVRAFWNCYNIVLWHRPNIINLLRVKIHLLMLYNITSDLKIDDYIQQNIFIDDLHWKKYYPYIHPFMDFWIHFWLDDWIKNTI